MNTSNLVFHYKVYQNGEDFYLILTLQDVSDLTKAVQFAEIVGSAIKPRKFFSEWSLLMEFTHELLCRIDVELLWVDDN